MRKEKSDEIRICESCRVKMKVISKSCRLLDREEMGEMTDAVASEYEVAEMNDDPGEFGIDQIVYECPKCHKTATVEFL